MKETKKEKIWNPQQQYGDCVIIQ